MDRTDHAILDVLQNDARISNKELAARVGLAASSCLERVRRLEQSGALRGAHAEVDPGALGIALQALVMVRLRMHKREALESLLARLLERQEVTAVYHVAGAHDYLVHVAVPGPDYLRTFILDHITVQPEVTNVETSLIFGFHRNHVLPWFGEREVGSRGR